VQRPGLAVARLQRGHLVRLLVTPDSSSASSALPGEDLDALDLGPPTPAAAASAAALQGEADPVLAEVGATRLNLFDERRDMVIARKALMKCGSVLTE